MNQTIIFFFDLFIRPRHAEDDIKRKELILNLILSAVLALSVVGIFLTFYVEFQEGKMYTGIKLVPMILVFLFLSFLLFLSRCGKVKTSSYLVITTLFIFSTYFGYKWGVDLPSTLLSYSLIIVISSVLISTRFGFFISTLVVFIIISLAYLESIRLYVPERSWQQMSFKIDDAIEYVVIMLIITGVSWISNSEAEKSLERAKKSERNLSKERDNLEIKVLERTKELRQAQLEKMAHIYRFVEFGRLSSGLFHDLMSPLTAISVALEGFKNKNVPLDEISEQTLIAVNSSRRISNLLKHARKHINIPTEQSIFSLNEELKLVIDFLSSKWKKSGVILTLTCPEYLKTFGNSTIFTHIATNIISNAIDAYEGVESNIAKEVVIDVSETTENILLKITDFGHGIKSENISSIFEPFFTTKDSSKGTGLGLSATKHTLEKYFKGQISVTSSNPAGTTFYVKFPRDKSN